MHTKKVRFTQYRNPQTKEKETFDKTFTYQTEEHCANAIVETMRKFGLLGYEILEEYEHQHTVTNS
jgi:hypothetical protein